MLARGLDVSGDCSVWRLLALLLEDGMSDVGKGLFKSSGFSALTISSPGGGESWSGWRVLSAEREVAVDVALVGCPLGESDLANGKHGELLVVAGESPFGFDGLWSNGMRCDNDD